MEPSWILFEALVKLAERPEKLVEAQERMLTKIKFYKEEAEKSKKNDKKQSVSGNAEKLQQRSFSFVLPGVQRAV